MLTSDLLIARNIRGKIHPAYLKVKDKDKYLQIAETLISIFKTHVGLTIDELNDAVKSSYSTKLNKKLIDGFVKLLKDRCETDVESKIAPEKIRKHLFNESARHWKGLTVKSKFNKQSVINKVSEQLKISPSETESSMYADLKGSQVIQEFEPITAEGLFNKYNLSLAQAVLFKASKVRIDILHASVEEYRFVFHYIKFFRLIHKIIENPDGGYTILLDGPFSLFKSVQKYGYQMALFLPVITLLDRWKLKADLLWGKRRQKALFEVDHSCNLKSHYKISAPTMLDECDTFYNSFQESDNNWEIQQNNEVFDLKSEGVFIPDFIFQHKDSKEKIYMEVFGFWSRDTVWKRIETLESNFPYKMILAVSKKLRISDKALDKDIPSMIYVYSSVIMVNNITKILDDLSE